MNNVPFVSTDEQLVASAARPAAAPAVGSTRARPRMALATRGLSDGDTARLTIFLRIGSDRLRGEWMLATDGAADLMLCGDPAARARQPHDGAGTVVEVIDGHASAVLPGHALVRPLQFEAVIDLLADIERRATQHAAPRAVAPEAPAPAAAPSAEAPPAALPIHAQAAAAPDCAAGDRFRLRRWPPAALLQRNRYNLRIANFLAARHVALNELTLLSGVEAKHCEALIHELFAAGVLDVKPALAVQPATTVAATPAAAPPAAAPRSAMPTRFDSTLFDKIRRRLGIGVPT